MTLFIDFEHKEQEPIKRCKMRIRIAMLIAGAYFPISALFRQHIGGAIPPSITDDIHNLILSTAQWLLWIYVAIRLGQMRVGDAHVCSNCEYELGGDPQPPIGKGPIVCPECGADLTAPKAIARGRRMSPEVRARMYWFVFVMWALSTAVWLFLVL